MAGWNWFSVNVAGDDMSPDVVLATLNPELNDQIKDQNDFAIYYGEEYGWQGALTSIDVTSMYMISNTNAGTLEYVGVPVNPVPARF
jgi:alkylation response protein AidB-like acyl-CoA dehydrogenase